MHGESFADVFAQRGNFATAIDARIKIAFVVFALIINLLASTVITSIIITTFCLMVLATIKIPARLVAERIAMPLFMAVVVFLTQLFLTGREPLFTIVLAGWHLTGYADGLARGILIMGRVIAGVSLILLLGFTTPVNRLLLAARWFRMPRIFIELSLLVYRYVFVLLEEVNAIKEAQRVRLGYQSWGRSMKSLYTLGGSLIFRAYDRAERVFEAMIARGYAGTLPVSYRGELGGNDIIAATGLTALLVLLYLTGRGVL